MSDWFSTLAAGNEIPVHAASELEERGFVVLADMMAAESLERLTSAYDEAMTSAMDDDIRVGSTSTKVSNFVTRGEAFDHLYVLPPLLEAGCQVIGGLFKLSSFRARTLRSGAYAQELQVGVPRHSADWALLGFILTVDDFRPDNGSTRFVPVSHRWSGTPEEAMSDVRAAHEAEVLASGAAGSLLVFNGSAWHGHTANTSNGPRRSNPGRVHSSGRARRDRFRGAHAGPDACASQRTGPGGAGLSSGLTARCCGLRFAECALRAQRGKSAAAERNVGQRPFGALAC